MGQQIVVLRKVLDEGDPGVTVQQCCTCTEDPRPGQSKGKAGGMVQVVYSADGDVEDVDAKEPTQASPPPTQRAVVHTEDEIRVEQPPEDLSALPTEERAKLNAEVTFRILRDDWDDKAMEELKIEIGKLALSRERVVVVLQNTQDKRLNCEQLNELLKTVALEAHKEQVLLERYAHLTDKSNFENDVINAFSLSKSVRGSVMKKLTKFLASKNEVMASVDDTTM